MTFSLGKPVLVMVCLALIGGTIVSLRQKLPRRDLEVWVFADSHAESFRKGGPDGTPSLAEQFYRRSGKTVGIDLIGQSALDTRLVSLFMADAKGPRVPDLVETEIGSLGKFFRPPVADVGFLPLNDLLESSGDLQRILPSRLATYTKRDPKTGRDLIFGVPVDVHPTAISYRKDLFDQAGVDLAAAKTWPDFQARCLAFQRYWAANGHPERMSMELSDTVSDQFSRMLLQRHINLLDRSNQQHLTDDRVAGALELYAGMVAGPDRIGADTTRGGDNWIEDFARGDICAMFTEDWRSYYLKRGSGPDSTHDLTGKVGFMALPRFDPDDAPTSTWGGTMIGIPRGAHDPRASWALIRFLYFSPESLAARQRFSNIIPPETELWTNPIFHQPDPYYGGQKVSEQYIEMARQLPTVYVTPYTYVARAALDTTVFRAATYVRQHGTDGLDSACRQWLAQDAAEVQLRVDFGKFE